MAWQPCRPCPERYDAVLLDQALGRAPRWNAR
jgi:hypothetical protein